jgi:hypothetical protein
MIITSAFLNIPLLNDEKFIYIMVFFMKTTNTHHIVTIELNLFVTSIFYTFKPSLYLYYPPIFYFRNPFSSIYFQIPFDYVNLHIPSNSIYHFLLLIQLRPL